MNNAGFVNDKNDLDSLKKIDSTVEQSQNNNDEFSTTVDAVPERDSWGKSIEFLMSCIAMSVGLGNVWRFPFTALENGGGAFLLPYLIVLFVIGRPLYYLEMVIGQFSSKNSIDVFDMVPFFRGTFLNLFSQILRISNSVIVFILNIRIWIWSINRNFLAEHILCFNNVADRSIFVGLVSIAFAMDTMQRRMAELR